MTRDEALVVLGVEPQAEAAEVDSAYRRLMRTVHPDICSGPEAGRLARQAAVARGVLREQSQASLSPIGSAQHRSRPQSVWPMSGYPPGVVDDDHLARIVVAVVEVVGGCLSRDEVVGAVVGAVEWGGVAPAVRRAAVERLRHRDFWGFGQRSGLWKLRGRDIVLPRGQYTPGFRARAPRSGPNGSEPPLAPPPGRVWWISVALLLGACAVFLVLSAFEAELRSRSSALPTAGLLSVWGFAPAMDRLGVPLLDPDLVDHGGRVAYGCAGLPVGDPGPGELRTAKPPAPGVGLSEAPWSRHRSPARSVHPRVPGPRSAVGTEWLRATARPAARPGMVDQRGVAARRLCRLPRSFRL